MRLVLFAAVAIALIGGLFYGDALREVPASLAGELKTAFALPFLALRNFLDGGKIQRELIALRLENQSLRGELLAARIAAPDSTSPYIAAKVHAAYPFNDRNMLTIAAGRSAGIAEGDAVLADHNLFLGEVADVHETWSVVRTVFDPGHELPVKIGHQGTLGLLRGGTALIVSLVAKAKAMNEGDAVYTASKELPYGLRIGTVRAIAEDPAGAFKSADVAPAYTLSDLEQVYILPKQQ